MASATSLVATPRCRKGLAGSSCSVCSASLAHDSEMCCCIQILPQIMCNAI